ncbi:alpha/beta hydrolase [Eubacteriales bacterium OttesenSCG-928-K08]|nr:alpha/beta hydrolase [Eubacteriales bacterium OttesenSCG-928-K08]
MFVTVEGVSLHYTQQGEGAPVLILHGWMASVEAMQCIANEVERLGKRAISLDFPGFGKSQEPPEVWGVPEYAKNTRAFIKALNIEGCDVVCHSFGGRVTIALASEEPELFNRLVLVDAAGIRPRRTLKWYLRTYTYKLGKLLSKVRWIDKLFHLSERRKNAGSEDYKALKSDLMRAVFVKVVNLDLKDRLKHIKNPTLLVWGTQDTSTPLYMGEMMEKLIPDAGLVRIEGAGHFSYAERYPQFCAVLRVFLGQGGQ